jgi:hypothetical protein
LIVGSLLIYNLYTSTDPEAGNEVATEEIQKPIEEIIAEERLNPTEELDEIVIEEVEEKNVEELVSKRIIASVEDKTRPKPVQVTPEVILPDMVFNDENIETLAELDMETDLGIGAKLSVNVNKTEIENLVGAGYTFHYQYYNNKLYLYGDFSSSPYELLEIEYDGSTKLYFFYEGNFHRIIADTKEVTMLRPLRNEKTIKELQSLQEKNK